MDSLNILICDPFKLSFKSLRKISKPYIGDTRWKHITGFVYLK